MSRSRSNDTPVTLLPFLAVLICTMGALIVLLVVVMQQARVEGTSPVVVQPQAMASDVAPQLPLTPDPPSGEAQNPLLSLDGPQQSGLQTDELSAAADSPGPTAEQVDQANQEREKYLWEIQMLAEAHQNMQQRLSEKNLELGHLEEHSQRLIAELKRLQESANDATSEFAAKLGKPPTEELAGLEKQINVQHAELAALQSAAGNSRNTYQLVPYNGSRGTTRRPIYVECTADSVTIQPEGIRLAAEDFSLPKNAGNPLAAALRSIREYWAAEKLDDSNSNNEEPYPLLVIRPGGEKAYAACRAAMKSWDNEFGYELVPSDVELAYPQQNAGLAETIQQTVAAARQQQQHMLNLIAATSPIESPTYRASRSAGGFVREGGPSPKSGFEPFGDAGNSNGQNGKGPSPKGDPVSALTGSQSNGQTRSAFSNGEIANGGNPNDPNNDMDIFLTNGQPGTIAGLDPKTSGRWDAGTNDGRPSAFPSAATTLNAYDNENTASAKGNDSDSSGSTVPSMTHNESGFVLPSDDDSFTNASAAGEVAATNSFDAVSRQQSSQASAASSSSDTSKSSRSTSLANTRGRDWALPNAVQDAIPIERPLFIAVNRAQMVLEAEPGTSQVPVVVTLQNGTSDAAQALVTTIWQRIKSWGVAGPGVYWRPTLRLDVAPDGEVVFAELTALMQDSGLLLERN